MASSLIVMILYLPPIECLLASQIPNRKFLHRAVLKKPLPSCALPTTSTRLHFSEFNESPELLEALLPPEKSESSTRLKNDRFQRMRLGEQLRLNRRQSEKRLNAEAQEVMFQRARLAEQLRLEKYKRDARDAPILSERAQTSADPNYGVDPLQVQLAKLHQMVEEAASSSSGVSSGVVDSVLSQNTTSSLALIDKNTTANINNPSNTISSLVDFLSDTHLPLAPREDASLLSLALAPLAHLGSAVFLLCASLFYAVMAPLDVIWNDHKAKACLHEGGNVWKSCWSCMFTSITRDTATQVFHRAIEVARTSVLAFWYVTKCVGIRARHSKYANECLDAGTGFLRYAVYAMRSIQVLWREVMNRLYPWRNKSRERIRMIEGHKRKKLVRKQRLLHAWRRKFHLYSVLLSIKNARAQRLYRQQSLQLQQRQLRLENEYQEKLRALNQDRITLERDWRTVQSAQSQIEEERKRLLFEGLNVMAWYASLMTDDASSNKVEDTEGQKRGRGWGFGNWWKAWD